MSGISRKRAVLCCQECSRRKVRCDKRVPCRRCVEQGLQCIRNQDDEVRRQESPATAGDAAAHCPPQRRHHSTSPRDAGPSEGVPSAPAIGSGSNAPLEHGIDAVLARLAGPTGSDREVTDAATILEFIAWGRHKEVGCAMDPSPFRDEPLALPNNDNGDAQQPPSSDESEDVLSSIPPLELLRLLLPERHVVQQLVHYHIECLLWYHGSFHGPTVLSQLQRFYDVGGGDVRARHMDLQWVALLFSILTGTLACGDKGYLLDLGFGADEQESLSKKWLQAVVKCLDLSQFMANPSMVSLEAIATLTMSAHMLGSSNQQAVLLASAVRIAQGLGLHRVVDDSSPSVEKETGRRVWTQLCTQDWFSIPFSECYLVNPLYSKAQPSNCDDTTLRVLPLTQPTITSYCRLLNSIATLMPNLQDAIERSVTQFAKYEQVLIFDRKMRSLVSEQRPHFLRNEPVDPSWPRWILWARRALAITSSHKIIMIHRKFLSASFTDTAFAFTRKTCIAAAKTIVKEVVQVVLEDGPVLWIYHAFAVAAGITLGLDVLHRESSDPALMEHRNLVEEAISLLRAARNSKIAQRGVKVLTGLVAVEADFQRGRTGLGRKRKRFVDEREDDQARRRKRSHFGNNVHNMQEELSKSPENDGLARNDRNHLAEIEVPNNVDNDNSGAACVSQDQNWSSLEHHTAAQAMGTLCDLGGSPSWDKLDSFANLLNLAQTDFLT